MNKPGTTDSVSVADVLIRKLAQPFAELLQSLGKLWQVERPFTVVDGRRRVSKFQMTDRKGAMRFDIRRLLAHGVLKMLNRARMVLFDQARHSQAQAGRWIVVCTG